jgi:hypothetical protein
MAENHGNRDRIQRGEQPDDEDMRGRQDDEVQGQEPQGNTKGDREPGEGRDRPPSNRGREPNGPWLGGG